ncbi:MAG: helix-turn-helix domain-containing protein [Candidatus Aenigmatarchaeota archaeon]
MANILNVKQNVLDALRNIGLNLYERKLWVALLSKGSATAGELADISNVPRSRCYDVLESLADKGFVIIQPSKPMRYVAIKPKEALEKAKKRLLQKTEEMIKRIDDLASSEIIKELEKIYTEGIKVIRPEDFSGALRGRDAYLEQIETMLENAKKSAKFLLTEQALQEIYEKKLKALEKAWKAGIQIKIAAPITKKTEQIVKELKKYAQIKDISNVEHVNRLLSRVCSIDGKHILLSLTDDIKTKPNEDIAFWAQSNHAAGEFFEPIFDLIWEKGKEI